MKTVVVYLAVAVLLIFIISRGSNQNGQESHRRLKLQPTLSVLRENHHAISFDPRVAGMKREMENKEWRRQFVPALQYVPQWEDFERVEKYLNDEERFNVTLRILALFPMFDLRPTDGFLSLKELTEWYYEMALEEADRRTEREMKVHDKDRDGYVSFEEYSPPGWAQRNDSNASMLGWWGYEHFNASDEDNDGRLSREEFNDFLHPSDRYKRKLQMWLCKLEVRERDSNKDGKIDFNEFFQGMFDFIWLHENPDYTSLAFDVSNKIAARVVFVDLDADNDGYLSAEELLPVIDKLQPGEIYFAKLQAESTMKQADKNKDGQLDLQEMTDKPYVFYNAIFAEEDDYYHDEFC